MYSRTAKVQAKQSTSAAGKSPQRQPRTESMSFFADNRPEKTAQRKAVRIAGDRLRTAQTPFAHEAAIPQLRSSQPTFSGPPAKDSISQSATSLQQRKTSRGTSASATGSPVVQRLEKIEQKQTFPKLGTLEISFHEPSPFFGGLEGFIAFEPSEGGPQAEKIDLVQIASMKYAARSGYDGPDPREGENVATSGGSVIKDAMRTGPVRDGKLAPDFHIDKVYDAARTLPGESDSRIVRDPAYNADRRQEEGGDQALANLNGRKPRTLPGKNWRGEIKPTTLIDAPRSPEEPVDANFETVVIGDDNRWASVEWGFTTEYNISEAGVEVKDTRSHMDLGSTNRFKDALRNYEEIVRSRRSDTSDEKIAWLEANQSSEGSGDYPDEYEYSGKAFRWALGRLSASVEQTKAPDSDISVSDQTNTALKYLEDMMIAAERFLRLETPPSLRDLKGELQAAVRHAETLF